MRGPAHGASRTAGWGRTRLWPKAGEDIRPQERAAFDGTAGDIGVPLRGRADEPTRGPYGMDPCEAADAMRDGALPGTSLRSSGGGSAGMEASFGEAASVSRAS